MKVIILNSKLKEGLNVIERSIQESGNLPILKNVLIKVQNGKITLAGTNLEFASIVNIPGKINEAGVVTAPFQAINRIVSNSDSERITLELKDNNLNIETDNYHAKIQVANNEDFPIIPKIKQPTNVLKINNETFKNSLLKILPAAQVSEIRPEISGVLIDCQISLLKIAATDTFRLSEKTLNNNQFQITTDEGFKTTIPLKTIQEVVRIFNDSEEIQIQFDDNQVLFKNENIELISRLIDGEYPDYQAIIPKKIDTELRVNREQFINAIKLVSGFSGKVNDIKVSLHESGKTIEIHSANQNLGENRYLIPIKHTGNKFEEISFNWRYLLDGLRSNEGESVVFGVNGDSRPAVIKSPEDSSYFYILMPIKI